MRPDEADSQLAFASPPWPDLPRHRRDRISHPHPPDPAPTTRTVPDPAPVRAGGQYGAEGYQADSPVPKIPAQAGIHLLLLPHAQEETSGDGPLPPQGPAGKRVSLPQTPLPRRMPGSLAETTRSQSHEAPACAGEAGRGDVVIPENPAGFIRDPVPGSRPRSTGSRIFAGANSGMTK